MPTGNFITPPQARSFDRFDHTGERRSPHLPAPSIQTNALRSASTTADLQSASLYDRLKDGSPKLTSQQAETYLKANHRSAASLLAAYRTTGDRGLLAEAMEKYPNDPQVGFEAAFSKNASPEERRQWLEALKRSDPSNALGNYLSALDLFKAGQTDQAVQELVAASGEVRSTRWTQAALTAATDRPFSPVWTNWPSSEARFKSLLNRSSHCCPRCRTRTG